MYRVQEIVLRITLNRTTSNLRKCERSLHWQGYLALHGPSLCNLVVDDSPATSNHLRLQCQRVRSSTALLHIEVDLMLLPLQQSKSPPNIHPDPNKKLALHSKSSFQD